MPDPGASHYAEIYIDILKRADDSYRIRLSIPELAFFPLHGASGGELAGKQWFSGINTGPQNGQQILNWLLANGELRGAWNRAFDNTPQRCIRLILDPDAPELRKVPWELIYDAGERNLGWIAGTKGAPFSRLLPGSWDPVKPIPERPVKVLVAIASPTSGLPNKLKDVNSAAYTKRLQEACADFVSADLLQLTFLEPPCSLGRLEMELQKGYHILHLIGHGDVLPNLGGPLVYMADKHNAAERVTAVDFAAMLGRQVQAVNPLQLPVLRMVLLASCKTAAVESLSDTSSFAEKLGEKGLPVVLAMQDLVEDETAMRFMSRFYHHLLTTGRVDLAGNLARSELLTDGVIDAHVPVLFSRLKDNRLLDVSDRPPPPLPFEPEMVLIPDGFFSMGASPVDAQAQPWEKPGCTLYLPAYRIGKKPVTNAEYAQFIQECPKQPPPVLNWQGRVPQELKKNHPVVGLSWQDAVAYCKWLRGRTGKRYRLPSEAEWEKAARGSQGGPAIYPWGDAWQAGRCHIAPDTAPVSQYPAQNDYGCFDLVGNAWEWTCTLVGSEASWQDARIGADARNVLEPGQPGGPDSAGGSLYFVLRGGSRLDGPEQLRCSARDLDNWQERSQKTGFRVVMDLSKHS